MQASSTHVEIIQVGILVRNVEETARTLEKLLGIGPFEIFEPDYHDLTLRGKPARYKMRLGHATAGRVQLELIQPLYGDSIYDEFIRRKGYGLHHLGVRTDNIERSIAEMQAGGFKVIQSGNRPGVKWVYLDTEEAIGIILELIAK